MTKHVLIVEHNESIRDSLADSLEREGYSVTAASSGEESLLALTRAKPDIVLLDTVLPDTSGLEVLRTMRETLSAPIIMFTNSGSPAEVSEAIAAGATDYVLKVTGVEELIARIRRRVPATADTPSDQSSNQPGETPHILYVGEDSTVDRLVNHAGLRSSVDAARVATLQDALSAIAEKRPAVVVMDLKLRDADGLGVLKSIDSEHAMNGLPIVMVADSASPEIRRSVTRNGAEEFYVKPFNEIDFDQTVRNLVNLAGRRRAA